MVFGVEQFRVTALQSDPALSLPGPVQSRRLLAQLSIVDVWRGKITVGEYYAERDKRLMTRSTQETGFLGFARLEAAGIPQ